MLSSPESGKRYVIPIYGHTSQTDTVEDWIKQIEQLGAEADVKKMEQARMSHQKWWNEFWNRSWIRVSSASQVNDYRSIDTARGESVWRFGTDSEGPLGRFPQRSFVGDVANVRIFKR